MIKKVLRNKLSTPINSLLYLTIISQMILFTGLNLREALALPQEEVLQKLSIITVYTLANDKGDFLFVPDQNKKNVALLYISKQDAQNLSEKLKKKNPNDSYQIIPVSLAEMYKLVKEKTGQENPPVLNIIPVQRQVDAAKNLLREQNQSVAEFKGVPLFYLTYQENQKENFLTAKSGQQSIIPLSFEKETLQQTIQQVKQEQPEIASTLQIRVMPLESLIILFEQKDNEAVRKMVIVPSQGQ